MKNARHCKLSQWLELRCDFTRVIVYMTVLYQIV